MWRILAVVLAVFVAAPASADPIARELQYFKAIDVVLLDSAKDCGITDEKLLQDHLRGKLGQLGIKENADRYARVRIDVAAQTIPNSSLCAIHTLVRVNGALGKDNVVTKDPLINAAMERLEVLPITVWTGSSLVVRQYKLPASGKITDRATNSVLEQLDAITGRLAEARAN
ncbi:MAG: hypothetical protein QNJ06_19545 [Kiloniellales bacterium]|nr:hypothetical protein [Kiloniellales bacterium]MDJ0972097.1 hypothetical protein [Kiloniellales bacterium]